MTPHHYHGAKPGESEEAFATRCADELEKLILAEGPDTVAAMWAEPVMGAGGVIVPPRTYFEKIQAVLRKYDVLLVADEVICGFWRTGNYWGSRTFNIRPDILVCAKALSSSFLPISAVMVNERVFQGLAEDSHSDRHVRPRLHLFRPSGAGGGRDRDAEDLRRDAHRRACRATSARTCRRELRRRFADHPLVGEVRGVGLIAAIELVADKATHRNFDPKEKVGARLVKLGEEQRRDRPGADRTTSLAFSPPLIITEAEIDEMLAGVGKALDELTVQLRREKIAAVA